MKNNKIMICLAAAALLAGSMTGVYAASQTYTPGAGVADSPHNINRVAPGGDVYDSTLGNGRTCAYCHTPHHAISDSPELVASGYNPLWSHEVSTGTYTGYASPTFDGAAVTAPDILIGPSRLCMSCHDGVIAVDQHYGAALKNVVKNTGDTWGGIDVADGVTKSLANDHPIGFKYNLVMAGAAATNVDKNGGIWYGIRPLTTEFTVDLSGGKTYNPSTKAYVANSDAYVTGTYYAGAATVASTQRTIQGLMHKQLGNATDSYMTCASCHDVHNKENPENYLLINLQAQSQICLTCHKSDRSHVVL